MNDYRITYDTKDAVGQAIVTAIDEKDARRTFKEESEIGTVITAIELIRENVTATKAQERRALGKIKDILAPLGPNSYVATAFEGCLRDAEDNIEDDAAYSMKGRYETAQEKLRREIAEHQATKKELERARMALRDAENDAEFLARRALSPDDLTDIAQLIADKVLGFGKEVSNAAARIVEAAEQPDSAAFQNAVKDHRAAQTDLHYYTALLSRVNTAKVAAQHGGAET